MMIPGVDLSNNNAGPINWHLVKEAGARFVFLKATEGLRFEDPTFSDRWAAAQHIGLVRGAYCYLRFAQDGAAQADYLHEFVRSHGHFQAGDMVAVDVEEMGNEGLDGRALPCLRDFLYRARRQIDKQIVVYVGRYFWEQIGGTSNNVFIQDFPLWLPEWGPALPRPIAGWPVLTFWQRGVGRWPGVPGDVDLDEFNGSEHQLATIAHAH